MENKIPFDVSEVTQNNKTRWACQTINLLECQHLKWELLQFTDTPLCVEAFNYGNGVRFSSHFDKNMICVQPLDGEPLITEVVVHKGSIKHIRHETKDGSPLPDTKGDLHLMISAVINLHLNKHTGFLLIQSIGKHVVAINFHIDEKRFGSHDEEWRKKLNNVYNGLGWKI